MIPTHHRPHILRKTLDHIEVQTIRDQLEVVIVSDGPDPKTAEMIQNLSWSFPIQYFAIPKSQQGAARNAGVTKARGKYVLFIGDDIFLEKDACEKHLTKNVECRTENVECAILGYTTWDPSVEITPVMRWLERTGWQFGYGKIGKYAHQFVPQSVQHRFTYASHISLPWKTAHRIPFREDITLYGWEDTEWGLRLKEEGVFLWYEPEAKSLHHHRIELSDSLKRMELIGQSLQQVTQTNPSFDRMPRGLKQFAYKCLSFLPTMRGQHYRALIKGLSKEPTHQEWA